MTDANLIDFVLWCALPLCVALIGWMLSE
jgi:hypothetical protein